MREKRERKRYEVILSEQAERAKQKLPPSIQEAIEDRLEWLAENVHIAYQIDHFRCQIHDCDLGKHDEVYRRLTRC